MGKLAINGGSKTVTLSPGAWPRVGEEEIAAVTDGLRRSAQDTNYISAPAGKGPVGEFERAFASFMGSRHAMTTSGCGPALHIALMAAGVQAGDEVIVSPYSWGQTVSCILHQNAIPIFADIDPRTYTLDPASVESKISDNTRAIVVVHIYGHPADMDPIVQIAQKRGLMVVEDNAQATGAIYKGRRTGSIGHLGCFSIGDGKNIMGGEGGVLLTGDDRLYRRANLTGQHPARHNDIVKDDPELSPYIDSLIFTYRIHPVSCMICGVQLRYLDEWNQQRRANAEYLSAGLREMPGVEPPYVAPECLHVYHIYSPTFAPEEVEGVSRETYVKALQAEGVPVGLGYVRNPIHLRRMLQERNYFYGKGCPWTCRHAAREVAYKAGDCPVAEDRCARTELIIGGSTAWLGDQTPMMKQYLDAFAKVTENLDELREIEKQQ